MLAKFLLFSAKKIGIFDAFLWFIEGILILTPRRVYQLPISIHLWLNHEWSHSKIQHKESANGSETQWEWNLSGSGGKVRT